MCQQNTTIITGISGNFNQVIFFLSYHRDIMPRLILTTFIMITTNTVIINSDNQPNLSSQSSSLLSPSSSLLLIPSITLTALCGTIVFLLLQRVSVFFFVFLTTITYSTEAKELILSRTVFDYFSSRSFFSPLFSATSRCENLSCPLFVNLLFIYIGVRLL